MNTRVIALSRQVGTAGEEVAQTVAERLGFRLIDYQVVQRAAQEAGVSPETVSEAEHTPSLLTRILEALARNPSMPVAAWADPVPLSTTPMLTSTEYRQFIEDVIRDLGRQGDCVIVGHGASVVLRGQADVLRALITGSPKVRARRIIEHMEVDERAALKTVERTDTERVDYFRRFYETEWLHPGTYDLCINTDQITPIQAADLIAYAAQQR